MAPITSLSTGCLYDIMTGVDFKNPVLQILGTKRITSSAGSDRFRLLLSDGKFLHSFAMLTTQLNDMAIDGRLSDNTIIKINKYIVSTVNKAERLDKKVLILLEIEVLHSGTEVGNKIGDPVKIEDQRVSTPKPSTTAPYGNGGITVGPASINNSTRPSTSYTPNQTMNQSSQMNDQLTQPIASLTPYQSKWVIKARVTSKSAVRTWKNPKGEGKLFSMDLIDESGEIRCTAFKDQCDRYYDMIEVDKVYYISKCQLKPANKQYTSIKNDYEMTFSSETQVQECTDDVGSTPNIQYNLVPIAQIGNMEPNSIVDLIGVCKDTGDILEFKAKSSGRDLKKRDVTLVDNSNASVVLTLWNEEAEKFDGYNQPVLLLKGARITEFNGGKSINLGSGSSMKTNPDIPEGHKLRGWFDNGGSENVAASISARTGAGTNFGAEWMTFYEANARGLGNGDKPDYLQCKGVISMVKTSNPFYKACPQPDCNKKVVEDGNGLYICEKCKIEAQTFKYRILLNISLADWTANRWATVFSDMAEKMIGKTAQELGEWYDTDKEACETYISSINFQNFIFKLRIKAESFADSLRTKSTLMSATQVNYKEYNKYLINNIQELTGIRKTNY